MDSNDVTCNNFDSFRVEHIPIEIQKLLTVKFVTLSAIQTLLPPKPMLKHLKFKVGHLTVSLRRSFKMQNMW